MMAAALQLLSEYSVHAVVVVTLLGLLELHAEPPMQAEQLPLLVPQLVQPTLPVRVRAGRGRALAWERASA
jgi:hypothetical protein